MIRLASNPNSMSNIKTKLKNTEINNILFDSEKVTLNLEKI